MGDNNSKEIDQFIEKIVQSGAFKDEYSFHTLTFNTKIFDKIGKVKAQFKNYLNWLKKILNLDKTLCYFCSYEVGSTNNIHIHCIFNFKIDNKDNNYLIKQWNKVNNWDFFNEKGILIKNYTLKYSFEYKIFKEIIDYILKSIYSVTIFQKIYYIMYPNYVFNGSSYNLNENYNILSDIAQKIHEYGITLLLNNYKFNVEKNQNVILIKDIYNIWKEKFEETYIYIKPLKELIQSTDELKISKKILDSKLAYMHLQGKIEMLVNDIRYKIEPIKIHDSTKSIFKTNYTKFLNNFNSLLSEKDYALLSLYILKKEHIYYLVLDCISKTISLLKKKKNIDVDDSDLGILDQYKIKTMLVNSRFTESLFKGILKNIFKDNIFEYTFIYLYKNKDNDFISYLNNNKNELNDTIYEFLLKSYKNDLEIIYESLQLYKKKVNLWEISLQSYIVIILEALYMSKIIEFDEIKFYSSELKKERYYFYTENILNELILGYRPLNYDLPLIVQPKSYEKKINKEVLGGYYNSLNILFYENNNLKYEIKPNRLNLLNKIQDISYSINNKYLKYLLNLSFVEFNKFTGLNIEWFKDNIKFKGLKDIKKVEELFRIFEIFEGIYVSELYSKFNEIWSVHKIDQRGRKYFKGYPLNFMGNKLLRPLFTLNNINNIKVLDNNIDLQILNYDIYNNYISKQSEKLEDFNLFNIITSPKSCLVGFDAKSQVFQILGALILDVNLLNFCKVINLTDKDSIGLYEYVILKFNEDKKKINSFFFKIQELVISYCSNYNTRKGVVKPVLDYKYIIDDIFMNINREYIKEILMTWGYNKSSIELIKTTFNIIFGGYHIKNSYNYSDLNKISTIITLKIISIIENEFPMLLELKKLFSGLTHIGNLIEEGIYINIYENEYEAAFLQSYIKEDYIKINKRIYVKNNENDAIKFKKWITVNYLFVDNTNINKKKLDSIKSGLALLPNTAHLIDAELMYYVQKILFGKNIPVYSIHDGFYSQIIYEKDVKEAYKFSLINIFDKDILYFILKNSFNKFSSNENFNKIIKLIRVIFNEDLISYELDTKLIRKENLQNIEKNLLKHIVKVIDLYNLIKKNRKITYKELCELIKKSEGMIV